MSTAIARQEKQLLSVIAKLAASKGFRLHHCVPLTGATTEYWMLQRGSSMSFYESLESLREAVADMAEWRCRTPDAAAQESALRAALAELNATADAVQGGAA